MRTMTPFTWAKCRAATSSFRTPFWAQKTGRSSGVTARTSRHAPSVWNDLTASISTSPARKSTARASRTAGTFSVCVPSTPLRTRPPRLIASTWGSDLSSRTTGTPAFASCPPITPPIAPAPHTMTRM